MCGWGHCLEESRPGRWVTGPVPSSALWSVDRDAKIVSQTSRILEKRVLGALSGPDMPKAAKAG